MYLPTLKWNSSFLYETIARKKDIRNILLLQTNDDFFFFTFLRCGSGSQPNFNFKQVFLLYSIFCVYLVQTSLFKIFFFGLPFLIHTSFECHLPFLFCKHGQTALIFFFSSRLKLALRQLFVFFLHSFNVKASLSVDSSAAFSLYMNSPFQLIVLLRGKSHSHIVEQV